MFSEECNNIVHERNLESNASNQQGILVGNQRYPKIMEFFGRTPPSCFVIVDVVSLARPRVPNHTNSRRGEAEEVFSNFFIP